MLEKLIIPNKLKTGDKVAVVASSWGGPGTFANKANYGLEQLKNVFGVDVEYMPFATASAEDVYNNPQKRAEDLMAAFKDSSIKAIISAIGGDDSIRMLPFIDFEVIKNNPKIYLGYSDSTISHFMCLKAGLRSYYGPSIMAGFAENGGLIPFMENSVRKTLFTTNIIGEQKNNNGYVIKQHNWGDDSKLDLKRELMPTPEKAIINGSTNAKGRLVGGCLDVLEFLKGTTLWNKDYFKDAILFIEISEDSPSADMVKCWLRNYAASGILKNLQGILIGRMNNNATEYSQEQQKAILKVIKEEEKLDIPVLINCDFGHTDPQMLMPYGAMVEIDVDKADFSILEAGVSEIL